MQWVEGKDKGLAHSCFSAWRHWALVESEARKREGALADLQRRHADELAKVQKSAERKIQEGLACLEQTHKGAKRDLEVIIAKWEKGSRRGLLASVLRGWDQLRQDARKRMRRSQAVQMKLHQWLEGSKRGTRHTCWSCWKNEVFTSKSIQAERRRLESLMSGDRAERESRHKREIDAHRSLVEGARESVRLMVDKWALGQTRGLKLEVFQVWARYCVERAGVAKKCASVEITLAKWSEGDKRGDMHTCFSHWKSHSLHCALTRRHQAALESETQKMRGYLQDLEKKHAAEVDYLRGEAARRKDAAHKVTQYILMRWGMGDRKSLLLQVLKWWHRVARDCHRRGVQRAAVHQALLRVFEGKQKAAVHMTFLQWSASTKEARQEREHEEVIRREQAHWEGVQTKMERLHDEAMRGAKDSAEQRRLKALAQSESSIMKWMVGERKGLLRTFLLDWKRYKEAVKASRRKSLAVQASTLRFLEGERRGAMQMAFACWKNLAHTESTHVRRIDVLEKQVEGLIQRHEVKLARYAKMIGSDQEPVLKGWVFQMWKEIAQGIKYLEQERATEVKLEEMRRQHEMQVARRKDMEFGALRAFGYKDAQLLVWQTFEAWKAHFEKAMLEWQHQINQKEVLTKYADYVVMKNFTKDAASLLTSSFAEWHREAMILKHERYHDEMHRRVEEHSLHAQQMEQRMAELEDQLLMAYRQIDHITDTLQKELQTKEELTAELREAYDKMRKVCFTPTVHTPTTAVSAAAEGGAFSSWPSRPGSAQSRGASAGTLPASRSTRLLGSRDALGGSSNRYDQDVHPPPSANASPSERGLGGLSSTLGGTSGVSIDGALRGSRTGSPSRCDWDVAVSRMREEGLVRTDSSGRL